MLAAAKATYVDRFVRALPGGYDTVIDEESSNLSAGEKQLITIARAFLADPAILILDEATSSVDTRTEVLVQRAMATLRERRTSFVIAHRLSTIRDADLILVMEHGKIVEQGTHAAAARRGWRVPHALSRTVRGAGRGLAGISSQEPQADRVERRPALPAGAHRGGCGTLSGSHRQMQAALLVVGILPPPAAGARVLARLDGARAGGAAD